MKSLIEINANLDILAGQLERIASALERLAPPIVPDIAPRKPAGLEALTRHTSALSRADLEKLMEEGPERRLEKEYGW